ncbi:DUF7312 domain-containing protein [Halorientalis salina]|uniref:DUF7312 domain-containing protein n=1 Tax=Halorientalis salina TaxID=2932266 RepID=UPI0010AC04DA|nr:hypothetical protein [Halorientalis salina]
MTDDEDGWRYSVDDFPDDDTAESTPETSSTADESSDGTDPEADDESNGNVAGHIGGVDDELVPGTPTLENAAFVALGAVATVLFFLVVAGVI